ncbi:MAG: copper resistance CopC family protein [Actinomycetota bacterium]
MSSATRTCIGLCLGALVALLLVAPAAAHGDYVSSDPVKGDRLDNKPQHIEIVLSEAPVESSTITVFDGCGIDVTQATYVDGRSIHAVPKKSAGKGRWRVGYEIVSADDGHQTEGSFGFRVKGQCTAEAEPDATIREPDDDDEDGLAIDEGPVRGSDDTFPIVPVLAVAGVAVVGIALLARRGGA